MGICIWNCITVGTGNESQYAKDAFVSIPIMHLGESCDMNCWGPLTYTWYLCQMPIAHFLFATQKSRKSFRIVRNHVGLLLCPKTKIIVTEAFRMSNPMLSFTLHTLSDPNTNRSKNVRKMFLADLIFWRNIYKRRIGTNEVDINVHLKHYTI